jgi:DNA mismatch repair ATPase MutS
MLVPSRAAIRALRAVCTAVQTPCKRQGLRTAGVACSEVGPVILQAPKKRARKSKAKVETISIVASLPQGLLATDLTPLDDFDDGSRKSQAYPTVVQQAFNNMRKFEHCVLLTRVGSFYELYFEHAEQYGPLLGLKVGSKKTSAGPVAMAGFPFFQLERFLKMLVQDHGKHVAISEETANDPSQRAKSGGLMFDRVVKRIVTPGTLIDENFLSPFEHNYLLAVALQSDAATLYAEDHAILQMTVGLSWIDLSSGDFVIQLTNLDSLSSAIARVAPREIISTKLNGASHAELKLSSILQGQGLQLSFIESAPTLGSQEWAQLLDDPSGLERIHSFSREESASANVLLQYVKEHLPGMKLKLQTPVRQSTDDYMIIDKNSLRGLEITQTLRDGLFKGSLLQAVRRTCTESGARLLAQRLSRSTKLSALRTD